MEVKKAILEKWMVAQKKHCLSDKYVQMASELGLNPNKLGKIDNHTQETWKVPLPQFIEEIYYKRFKREAPETVKSLKQIMAEQEKKKKEQRGTKNPGISTGRQCSGISGQKDWNYLQDS